MQLLVTRQHPSAALPLGGAACSEGTQKQAMAEKEASQSLPRRRRVTDWSDDDDDDEGGNVVSGNRGGSAAPKVQKMASLNALSAEVSEGGGLRAPPTARPFPAHSPSPEHEEQEEEEERAVVPETMGYAYLVQQLQLRKEAEDAEMERNQERRRPREEGEADDMLHQEGKRPKGSKARRRTEEQPPAARSREGSAAISSGGPPSSSLIAASARPTPEPDPDPEAQAYADLDLSNALEPESDVELYAELEAGPAAELPPICSIEEYERCERAYRVTYDVYFKVHQRFNAVLREAEGLQQAISSCEDGEQVGRESVFLTGWMVFSSCYAIDSHALVSSLCTFLQRNKWHMELWRLGATKMPAVRRWQRRAALLSDHLGAIKAQVLDFLSRLEQAEREAQPERPR